MKRMNRHGTERVWKVGELAAEAGLRDSLYRMQAGEADRIESEFCGPSPARIEFITAANTARG